MLGNLPVRLGVGVKVKFPGLHHRGIAFTAFDHPMMTKRQGSVPLIAFGEMVQDGNRKRIANSLHANHALVDGQHVAKYYMRVQRMLDEV
jgi:chloramphenicol O-acetyltransferase